MPAFATQLAADRPDEIALRDRHAALGWAEVGDVLNRVANNAAAPVDLGATRRIAVFAENADETALAHLGGLLGGASSVPVNFHLTADETAYILDDSDSRIVFVGPETVERGLAAARPSRTAVGLATVVGWGCDDADGVVDWTTWLAGADDSDPPLDDSCHGRTCCTRRARPAGRRGPSSRRRCSPAARRWSSISRR